MAVKTGTSQSYHDNWTVGYSKHVTVGVWVGNFDRTPLRNSSGVTGAAPIFQGVMLAAERRAHGLHAAPLTHIVPPGGDTVEREICALSGASANDWCPNRKREWVAAEADAGSCTWHHMDGAQVVTLVPAEFLTRADAVRAGAAVPVVTGGEVRRARRERARLSIVSPADGSTYLIDPTLRREFQTLPLKAINGSGDVSWTVDGRPFGRPSGAAALEWPLAPGRHVLTARDARGREATSTVVVR